MKGSRSMFWSVRHRLKAVKDCPSLFSAGPMFKKQRRSVLPWLLWMVMPKASAKGNCVLWQRGRPLGGGSSSMTSMGAMGTMLVRSISPYHPTA